MLKQILIEQLRLPNPKYLQAQSQGRSTKGIQEHILNFSLLKSGDLLVPRGIKQNIIETCISIEEKVKLTDNRHVGDFKVLDSSKIKYRPYQERAVASLISSGAEGIIVSPAGSGKTIMGLSLIPALGQNTLWLTHTKVLAEQARARAEVFLPDIGEIGLFGAGKWNLGDTLTIAMVQTLIRNKTKCDKLVNTFGTLILDECHHSPAKTFLQVLAMFNPYFLYALTATPYRSDGLEALMYQAVGPASAIVTLDDVNKSFGIVLPKIRYRAVNGPIVEGNDIQDILKNNIVLNTKRNKLIISDVLKEAKNGHHCIVVSDRRNHCEILYKEIKRRWPKTGIATGEYNQKHVNEQIELLNDRDTTVLVATTLLLGEGFDVPHLDRAFICMPFRAQAKLE